MKSLLTIFTLVFSLMFSSISFAEWTKLAESMNGDTHYVDFERVRKHDGYVYYWDLNNLLKPDKDGDLSYTIYVQGDCKLFRFKVLTEVYYKQSMGRGTSSEYTQKNPKWQYPHPDSVVESVLKKVCSR